MSALAVALDDPFMESRHPQANRRACLGGVPVAYLFKRGKRRTIGFSVSHDGLVVVAPRWVALADVQAALDEKAQWIVRKLVQTRERQARMVANWIEWKDGVVLPFLGAPMQVVLDPRHAFDGVGAILKPRYPDASGAVTHASAPDRFDVYTQLPGGSGEAGAEGINELHVGLVHSATGEQIRDVVQAWLMRQAKRVFTERLDHFAPRLRVQWRKLSLSSAGTRWGSARSDGAIRLHWRLIHFPVSVIDYVVAHELSHLRVMDHSPQFWATVASVVPDYMELRGQLRQESVPTWS